MEPQDNERLANLCGQFDEHLRQIERNLGVEVNHQGGHFTLLGDERPIRATEEVLKELYLLTAKEVLQPSKVHLFLQESGVDTLLESQRDDDVAIVRTRRGVIRARGANQSHYLRNIQTHDLSFGIGPAGTGKTYLAVASAVEALESDRVRRLVLVRPAVEAGERLGFLPGDLAQKIDPYLRPMYDALYEMLGFEKVNKLLERNVIEVAPLAYMRGRTLNEAFVILDEAQNTTAEQMKMLLTRIGFGSTAVVTGDVTQTDLPDGRESGLRQAIRVLKDVDGIAFNFFVAKDVVRHSLVKKIVQAYERSS
ncbi:MAG: phosphate starvation-inducible protein PhoH [Thiothrix sp.]|nr:MAG: phosphate starvation-inducible protein PhoH [Thiothrix sp.]